nr:Hypothetical protein, putative [Bodo saltans]|eukprot:CUG06913.1 Hypothetical protein, putative [Bodo saltans]
MVDSATTTTTSAKRPREDTASSSLGTLIHHETSAQVGGETSTPETSAPVPSVASSPTTDSGRPRRRFTQSAALLAGMQKMIAANQKRDVASGIGGDAIRQDRERMAKEARRNTLVDILNIAKGNAAKAAKAVRELQEKMDPVRGRLATLSSILDTAEVQEADYTSSFFLRCCDNGATHNDDVSCEKNVDDDAEKTNKDILGVLKSVVYVQPARHNDTTREVIRQQLYAMLDSYLAFRAIIDPILSGIKDARDAFLEKRRRQLAEAQELEEQNGAKNWGHRSSSSSSSSAAPYYSRGSSSTSASSSSSLPFIPMSPEEASCILRDSNSSATAYAGRRIGGPTVDAGGHQSLQQTTVLPTHEDAAAAPVVPEKQTELEWSVYESAMAALDDFE